MLLNVIVKPSVMASRVMPLSHCVQRADAASASAQGRKKGSVAALSWKNSAVFGVFKKSKFTPIATALLAATAM